MNTSKLLTILVAVLVASAGMGAAGAVQTDAETSIDASYDDGTVTLTVTQNGSAAENVSVEANDESVGMTDENGTLTFETDASEELELELEGETIDLERTYAIEDGELVMDSDEEADEDENADDEDEKEDDEAETDDESTLEAAVTYDNGTVDVTVTQNDSAVENATVEANDEDVGTTDANGTLTFETNASEELELEIESGEQEFEQEYMIEDGELVQADDDDEDDETAGPSENASDRAQSIFAVIQTWLDSGSDTNLGQLIQSELGGSDENPGNSENASENGSENANNGNENQGNSENASENANNGDDKPDESENASENGESEEERDDESEEEREDESEQEADDDEKEDDDDEDDDEDDEDEDEDDDNDDDDRGNGNANGNADN